MRALLALIAGVTIGLTIGYYQFSYRGPAPYQNLSHEELLRHFASAISASVSIEEIKTHAFDPFPSTFSFCKSVSPTTLTKFSSPEFWSGLKSMNPQLTSDLDLNLQKAFQTSFQGLTEDELRTSLVWFGTPNGKKVVEAYLAFNTAIGEVLRKSATAGLGIALKSIGEAPQTRSE